MGSAACFMLCWKVRDHGCIHMEYFSSIDFNIGLLEIDLRSLRGFVLCVFPVTVCQVWLGARCGLRSCACYCSLVHPKSQKVCKESQLSSLPVWKTIQKTTSTINIKKVFKMEVHCLSNQQTWHFFCNANLIQQLWGSDCSLFAWCTWFP